MVGESDEIPVFIRLDQFLKAARLVATGGEAKLRVQAGEVLVNGQPETRRGRKLKQGDVVEFEGERFTVEFSDQPPADS